MTTSNTIWMSSLSYSSWTSKEREVKQKNTCWTSSCQSVSGWTNTHVPNCSHKWLAWSNLSLNSQLLIHTLLINFWLYSISYYMILGILRVIMTHGESFALNKKIIIGYFLNIEKNLFLNYLWINQIR